MLARAVPPRIAGSEAGFSLIALVASVTIMLLLMGAGVPSWRYVMKNDREEELFFRGSQIAQAIERYQRKHGNAPPPSLEALVTGRYLRKLYADPMTRDGKWRLIHPGEALPAGLGAGLPGSAPRPGTPPRPGASPAPQRRDSRPTVGAIVGVASTSTEESLRLFNGRNHYNEWAFVAGQPRVLGRQRMLTLPGVGRPPGSASPSPATKTF